MWLEDPAARLRADRAYLQDYAGWVSGIHKAEAQVMVAAIRQSEDRDLRKALSTRLLQSRRNALLSIGTFHVAARHRRTSFLVAERLRATFDDVREVFREAQRQGDRPFWAYLSLPSLDQLRAVTTDPAVLNEYVDGCEQRTAGLARIAALGRQDMLVAGMSGERYSQILVASSHTVSAIKTGKPSDLRETSNTAFYLVDISDGELGDLGDLVAVACPTTPAMIEEIAEDIAFIDREAAETAALVDLVAEAGLLYTSYDAPPPT